MRLYARLAAGGIRRNGRLYAPYILTCSLMAMMYYIVCFLSDNSMLSDMKGGDMLREMMGLGIVIMGIFAGIFLFYTNSFLIKQRKREFGLYNILGMGKRNIARIMTWETAMVYLISIILGAGAGILFSKLAELLAVRILSGKAQYEFSVSVSGLISMLAVFAVIFLLIYLNVLRQVFFSKPIELLHSESAGEKPPRANWFLAVLGAVLLGLAYYMAVTIEEPMTALLAFFGAVLLVIIATYLLFIAGSVAICKALQKNRSYYYKTNHFISTSQMAYRMKRNGAGLASICILCTMVLVTLSSTICLYAGEEQMLYQRYPRDIAVTQYYVTDEEFSQLKEEISASLERHDITAENVIGYQYLPLGGAIFGNKLELEPETDAISELTLDLRTVFVLPIEDYNRAYGENIDLSDRVGNDLRLFGSNLCTVFPVCLVAVILLGVVAGGDVDARLTAIFPHGKAQLRRGPQGRKNPHMDTVGGTYFRRGPGKLHGMMAAVHADGHAALLRLLALGTDDIGKALCGPADDVHVHLVQPHLHGAPQSGSTELQRTVKPALDLLLISGDGFQLLHLIGRQCAAVQPLFVLTHVIHHRSRPPPQLPRSECCWPLPAWSAAHTATRRSRRNR